MEELKKNRIERTFIAIKPDGVSRSIVGKIITRFEDCGLKIIGMKMIKIDKEFAKKHYCNLVEKPFYNSLEKYITEGPVIAMVLEGVSAVSTVRRLVGPTEPYNAPPGTIRGDFAHITYEYADAKNMSIKNIIHASGKSNEAEYEINLWFKENELLEYKNANDHIIFGR